MKHHLETAVLVLAFVALFVATAYACGRYEPEPVVSVVRKAGW